MLSQSLVAIVDSFEVFSGIVLLCWKVLSLSDALFFAEGIVDIFSGGVCSSGRCSCYQSHWLY